MDVNMPPSSAMEAIKYSKYVSLMGVKALELNLNNLKNEKSNPDSCNDCNCKHKPSSNEELLESVCYACKHIIQNLVSFWFLCVLWTKHLQILI